MPQLTFGRSRSETRALACPPAGCHCCNVPDPKTRHEDQLGDLKMCPSEPLQVQPRPPREELPSTELPLQHEEGRLSLLIILGQAWVRANQQLPCSSFPIAALNTELFAFIQLGAQPWCRRDWSRQAVMWGWARERPRGCSSRAPAEAAEWAEPASSTAAEE